MNKKYRILLPIIPALLALLLILVEPFYGLDTMVSDKLYSQMKGVDNRIKIIAIDEATLAEFGPFSSWIREKSADLINTLYTNEENSPAVLAFDVMFIGESDNQVDTILAEAANNASNIVVASNLVYQGKTKYKSNGMPYYDSWNIAYEEEPYEALLNNAKKGFTNVSISKDGFVRSTQLFTDNKDELLFSFPSQIYNEYQVANGGGNTVEKEIANPFIQFFYGGKPGEVIRYSLKDVLDDKVPSSEFADSIILVGAYAPGMQDSYHSAAKRGSDMYGVEINANIVNALLHDKTARPVTPIIIAVLCALIIGIYTYAAREMKMYPALIVGLWIVIAYIGLGRVLATHGYIISVIYFPITCVLVMAWIVVEKYVLETIKKKRVLDVFKKYMAPQVIDSLAKDELFQIQLSGENRHVAVLFVDIRGFTTMSEDLAPEEVVKILNEYLSLTTSCIFEHNGMLDKFIGDATMAVFNAPNDQYDYVYQAVMTAVDMQKKGSTLGKQLAQKYGKEVSFGIGVNVGNAVVGNIGSESRMDYTAIGDTVNTAARLEARALPGEILISEAVKDLLKDRITTEFKERMSLKGKQQEVSVYRVLVQED